jgi:hypothetical protein
MVVTAVVFLPASVLSSDGFVTGKSLLPVLVAVAGVAILLADSHDFVVDHSDIVLATALPVIGFSFLGALDGWNAAIASAGCVASVVLFWAARSLSLTPYRSALLFAAMAALGLVIVSALIESYTPIQFSTRPPGGTIGNRNRMAHLIVIGAPALALLIVRVRDRLMLALLLLGSMLGGGALLLSRARGAWLAALAVMIAAGLIFLRRRRPSRVWPTAR